jgi:hypothetical protein
MLGGVDRPTNGRVSIAGTDIASLDESGLAIFRRRNIGLIYQFYNLIPVLNVEENITLPQLLDGRSPDKDRYNEIIAAIGEVVREGDIVFRRGGGLTSRAVLAADRGGVYSHVGIVVRDGAQYKIVHLVPGEPESDGTRDRIKMEGLELFFSPDRAQRGAIARVATEVAEGGPGVAGMSAEGGDVAGLGREAACRARELYEAGVMFDHEYDLEDSTRMYCTELIYQVYRHAANLDIAAGKRSHINLPGFGGDYILPTDIAESTYSTIIYKF